MRRWSGSRAARRQIKDLACRKAGSSTDSGIRIWGQRCAGQGWWCRWHEKGVIAEENVGDDSCADREQRAGISFMYACGSGLSEE